MAQANNAWAMPIEGGRMQITSRFTIAVHVIACIDYFGGDEKRVTSEFMSLSTNVNPVIIRTVLSQLKSAGIITARQGSGGANLAKPLEEISLYDVYKAVDCVSEDGLFHFHENPNTDCPVGKNIHYAMDERLIKAQSAMEQELKSMNLKDVVEDVKKSIPKQ